MATLGTTFLGSWLALRGGSKPEKEQGPPINAKSKEEESFVKYGDTPKTERIYHGFGYSYAGRELTCVQGLREEGSGRGREEALKFVNRGLLNKED
jgi:F-type H+-transporting ATPase subunit k